MLEAIVKSSKGFLSKNVLDKAEWCSGPIQLSPDKVFKGSQASHSIILWSKIFFAIALILLSEYTDIADKEASRPQELALYP